MAEIPKDEIPKDETRSVETPKVATTNRDELKVHLVTMENDVILLLETTMKDVILLLAVKAKEETHLLDVTVKDVILHVVKEAKADSRVDMVKELTVTLAGLKLIAEVPESQEAVGLVADFRVVAQVAAEAVVDDQAAEVAEVVVADVTVPTKKH